MSAEEPIRVGIIGCGMITQFHVDFYSKIPGAKIVALSDIREGPLRATGKIANVPPENQYLKFRDMLKRPDIQAVDVCLHNNLHMPATVAALEAGKHVYCEKPMAGSYADAATMLQTARKTGKKLHIQLSTLYEPAARAAKELIAAGALGEVYHARSAGHRRRGRPFVDGFGTEDFVRKQVCAGGALYDMGVYHIARALYLLGNPKVARITGKTYQRIEMDEPRRQQSGYNVEELGLGFVRFANDLSLDIIESWAVHLDTFGGSVVLGTKGGVRLDPFAFFHNVGDLELSGTADLAAAKDRWNNLRNGAELYGSSLEHWIAHLHNKVELIPTAEIALNTVLISEGIYLSDKLARDVSAEEVVSQSKSTSIAI